MEKPFGNIGTKGALREFLKFLFYNQFQMKKNELAESAKEKHILVDKERILEIIDNTYPLVFEFSDDQRNTILSLVGQEEKLEEACISAENAFTLLRENRGKPLPKKESEPYDDDMIHRLEGNAGAIK